MARIALLGGSFNPPHVAHQMIVLWVLSTGRGEQVWLIPAYRHPLGKQLVAFEHRVQMCTLASECFAPGTVQVSRVEEEIGTDGRTLHTIEHLRHRYPQHHFSLVLGADILHEKDSWYRFDAIERLVEIIVIGRSGYATPDERPGLTLPDVSSTMIREQLRQGADLSSLLPARVLEYIDEHGLYTGE